MSDKPNIYKSKYSDGKAVDAALDKANTAIQAEDIASGDIIPAEGNIDLDALNKLKLNTEQLDAIKGANDPSEENPFATVDDISASGGGTVLSVGISGSDGIEVDSGSPVTSTGTIALGVNASTLKTHLGLKTAAYTESSEYAPANKGVTNGDVHNHTGGNGAPIDYSSLSNAPAPMSQVEAIGGVITVPRTVSAETLKAAVIEHAPDGGTGDIAPFPAYTNISSSRLRTVPAINGLIINDIIAAQKLESFNANTRITSFVFNILVESPFDTFPGSFPSAFDVNWEILDEISSQPGNTIFSDTTKVIESLQSKRSIINNLGTDYLFIEVILPFKEEIVLLADTSYWISLELSSVNIPGLLNTYWAYGIEGDNLQVSADNGNTWLTAPTAPGAYTLRGDISVGDNPGELLRFDQEGNITLPNDLIVNGNITGSWGSGIAGIDGGSANSVYLLSQVVDGGSAGSVYTASQTIDGGAANG